MSLLNEYRHTEETIKALQLQLNSLKNDERLKSELEFDKKLRDLMSEYGKSLRDVISLLDPERAGAGRESARRFATPRAARKTKQYKNPHSSEVIETKGGNHRQLKEWKSQYGADVVESWLTLLD